MGDQGKRIKIQFFCEMYGYDIKRLIQCGLDKSKNKQESWMTKSTVVCYQ